MLVYLAWYVLLAAVHFSIFICTFTELYKYVNDQKCNLESLVKIWWTLVIINMNVLENYCNLLKSLIFHMPAIYY